MVDNLVQENERPIKMGMANTDKYEPASVKHGE